jgi:hypothetical protein
MPSPIRGQQFYTSVLSTSSFTFTSDMSILSVSFVLTAGVGSFYGTLIINGTIFPSAVPLTIGQSVTISSDTGQPIEGLTIDCSGGGDINIIARG